MPTWPGSQSVTFSYLCFSATAHPVWFTHPVWAGGRGSAWSKVASGCPACTEPCTLSRTSDVCLSASQVIFLFSHGGCGFA